MLVVRRGGLGDTLLMLPLLASMRREQPGAPLHLAGVREFVDVLRHFGAADGARSSESLRSWALADGLLTRQPAPSQLDGWTRIVADDPAFLRLQGRCRVQVFDPRPARPDVPLALQIAAQLQLAVDPAEACLVGAATGRCDGTIVLAPGSGAPWKCWPRDRWLELARRLAARAVAPTVVIGPVERERDDPRGWCWPEGTGFLADLDCVALAERLATARAFVGNDSGPTHLAAALRVPTVAIFGAGMPRVYAPPGAVVVEGDGAAPPSASVEAVAAALATAAGITGPW